MVSGRCGCQFSLSGEREAPSSVDLKSVFGEVGDLCGRVSLPDRAQGGSWPALLLPKFPYGTVVPSHVPQVPLCPCSRAPRLTGFAPLSRSWGEPVLRVGIDAELSSLCVSRCQV